MATQRLRDVIFILILFFPHRVFSHEKTLRKIVRNQSKMVQRPFSDTGGQSWAWEKKSGQSQLSESIIYPGFTQTKVFHKIQRPKMSTILSSVETARGKSSHSRIMSRNLVANDLRTTRNIAPHKSLPPQTYKKNEYYIDQKPHNSTPINNVAIESYYEIPTQVSISNFFPSFEDQEMQSIEQKESKEQTIVFPKNSEAKGNGSAVVKSVFISNKNSSIALDVPSSKLIVPPEEVSAVSEADSNKADFLLHGDPVDIESLYSYNASLSPYVCKVLQQAEADIDAQLKFSTLDIEPPWSAKKQYWNSIFDSRYAALMRKNRWPPLKVILVPRTHIDTFWKKSFEQYHTDSASKILANIVKKLQFYSNMTFTWNEVSHLSRWWNSTSQKSRLVFKRLLKSGRLEITTGCWVETDEATTHVFGLVHQMVEGHEWLKYNLNYVPTTAWLTNSVTHSPTMTYILSTLDISQLVMTNLHFSWEYYLAEYQYSDFVWLQNWDNDNFRSTQLNDALSVIGSDRYTKHSMMTHYLQFNSAGFSACGPNKSICTNDFNFAKSIKNIGINAYNVKQNSESLLEQYSKSGTITPHNTIIAPIGGPYNYECQTEFDFQYNNYQKIADFVNMNSKIYKATIEFGTPKDYFKEIYSKYKKYPALKGDFLNFADIDSGTPAYWTGFYTSRPFFKIMLRRLESTVRSTEILFTFALGLNAFRSYNLSHVFVTLIKCRENLARLLDRNVASGTLPSIVLRQAHDLILTTAKDCWYIQEVAASFLTSKPEHDKPYLHKYVFREGEFISTFKTVSPEDHVYIFNSLSHERTEIIELVTRHANVRILDYNRKEITVQINPIWKFTADNVIKISRRFFKITFVVEVPPMALELFRIKTTYDATQSAATIYCSSCAPEDIPEIDNPFPFNIQPIETGDIQLESYKHRLVFDELTGFLKTVVEKETNIAKTVVIDFGAFRDADVNSGMFLFNTNVSKPLEDILMPYRIGTKTRITMISSGRITTEISTVFGRFLQHTVRVFNLVHSPLSNAFYVESKVDYEVSPKNRDLELFMSIKTDIANGNPPQIYMDNNGFQHTARILNISRRIESNMYPITSMAFIQDFRSRLTYLTDHAQGVTALQEGHLVVMLDRRVLFDDGRGANEGLADSSATCHRQFILLENFRDDGLTQRLDDLSLPSLSAVHLANGLNYLPDIFTVKQNNTALCHYGFLPLIKTSFPCDVSVINFRMVLAGYGQRNLSPSTALLIMHRRSFSCRIDTSTFLRCDGESEFSLDKIIRNVRAVYQTNLAGTNKGSPLFTFTATNFLPMELATELNAMSTSGLLEWEFSLPSDQIISHGWYHGALSRTAAENLLQQDREFLVRDSSSQPDNYVLSCRSNGQHLHFVIQRIVVHPDTVYERCQYQFEDEAYDTVADLITSYVGSGKPISAASGARIQYPANRVMPLTNYIQNDDMSSAVSPVGDGSGYGNPYSLYSHFAAKPGMQLRPPFKKQRSHSLTPIDMSQHNNHGKSASADGVIQSQTSKHVKTYSGDSNSSSNTWDANLPTSPPAKPARYDGPKADDRRLELNRLYHVSGSDSGNGSGDSTQSSAHSDPNKSRMESDYNLVTPTIKQQFDYDNSEARLLQTENLDYVVESRINLENFQSQIIPMGLSKPLESETLHTIKLLLRTSGPRILANHLTKIDLYFLFEDGIQIEGLDKTASGLELCFLPQGRSLRMDVIERVETFRLLIAVTILTCQTDRQRADTINDWILLAVETKTALGNLYGFAAIMFGLCMPQVECLDNAWNILRRVYTDNAFMFEAKLRPCFKSMNDGTNPLPPNTTSPYILPPVLSFHLFDGEGGSLMQADDTFPTSLMNCLEFDFNATAAHLEAARLFPNQVEMFKRNARTVVQEMSSQGPTLNPTLLELFRTEFHINFLWGERGSLTTPNQRFVRLTDILTAMATKLANQPQDLGDVV